MKRNSTKTWARVLLASVLAGAVFGACSGENGTNGAPGATGTPGRDGEACTVKDNGDGTATITCPDGTTTTIAGQPGQDGTSCTVTDNNDGTKTITCEDGTQVTVSDGPPGSNGTTGTNGTNGDAGPSGPPGLNAGETPNLIAEVAVSAPPNGTHFVAGDVITITMTLTDENGSPVLLDSLSRANLYLNGPRDALKTKTASALLDASTDRSKTPHHYIDLLKSPPGLVVDGNVLTYMLKPVTTEEAGTYTVGLWSASKEYPLDQVFQLQDLQIGTATVEPLITSGCEDCHQGAANGKNYLHHIDPGYSPVGNPSLDSVPVRTCKACHNEDGYAAVRKCADGSAPVLVAGVYTCADGTQSWTYMNDPIVRRVHGVHMGKKLLSDFNINPSYGDFDLYEDVTFPFNVKHCTKCHADDSWKTKPSRAACGTCHDNLDYATGKYTPAKAFATKTCTNDNNCAGWFGGNNGTCVSGTCQCTTNAQCAGVFTGYNGVCNAGKCELQTHGGGPQTSDSTCAQCHTPDAGIAPIAPKHAVAPPTFGYTANVSLTPPANTTHYVAGEKPVVTIVLKKNNVAVDHTTITQANGWSSAYVFVNGPRAQRIPVLTTAARAETTSIISGPWNFTGQANLQLKVGPTLLTIPVAASAFADIAAVTPAEVVAWLNGNAVFSARAFAVVNGGNVTLLARPSTARTPLEIVDSPVGVVMGFTLGVYTAKSASTSYPANPFYKHNLASEDDPKATCTTASCKYQLDDVATAAPGTYTVLVSARMDPDGSGPLPLVFVEPTFVSFQVGTATAEALVATNCTDCHGTEVQHGAYGSYPFNVDVCGSCHDYRRAAADRLATDPMDGWGASAASGRENMGFGAAPLSRRVHGVHYGHYLDKPKEIHPTYDYSGVIFPQDVRNCAKCHSKTNDWDAKPNRLACFGCHDTDAAITHGTLMTYDPTPVDPWNGDEAESCDACHGAGKQFAASVVHNISAPYVTPYTRDP